MSSQQVRESDADLPGPARLIGGLDHLNLALISQL